MRGAYTYPNTYSLYAAMCVCLSVCLFVCLFVQDKRNCHLAVGQNTFMVFKYKKKETIFKSELFLVCSFSVRHQIDFDDEQKSTTRHAPHRPPPWPAWVLWFITPPHRIGVSYLRAALYPCRAPRRRLLASPLWFTRSCSTRPSFGHVSPAVYSSAAHF